MKLPLLKIDSGCIMSSYLDSVYPISVTNNPNNSYDTWDLVILDYMFPVSRVF